MKNLLIILFLFSAVMSAQDTQYLLFPVKEPQVVVNVYFAPSIAPSLAPSPSTLVTQPFISLTSRTVISTTTLKNKYGERILTYEKDLSGNIIKKNGEGLVTEIYKRDWEGDWILYTLD